ncbi:MAG TPA: class I SAM-dependent methyltransferase [Pyrinomonadaceae bacterium]|nr:class I SAM-dependent methyltransferase [Pyrinomonadaceae bacterium]
MAFFSKKTGQFSYFSQQVGERVWRGKNVLDFGGNIGNILRDPASTIDPERYWCIDVVKDSVERGRASYPQSHWVFYDRYCFFFNSHGVAQLPLPRFKQKFDYIVSFSVFTNTPQTDMLQLVEQLEGNLAKGGVLAFTFIDPNYLPWPWHYKGTTFQWRLEEESKRGLVAAAEIPELMERARHADWFMLVNGNDLYVETEDIKPYEPERQKTCHAFHTEKYMKRLFPHATIRPPVNHEMQHCCIIRKA